MNYDSDIRKAPPGEDDYQLARIEVEFAIPVFIEPHQQYELADLIERIARSPKNTPVNGVHWQSGVGSKPHWSQYDAAFLGKPVDPNAPAKGEPTFDDSVLYIETSARESSPEEQSRREKRAVRNPRKPGRYLLCRFEWCGMPKDKPATPTWDVREWDGKNWERNRYYHDTGNMENFELVCWQPLPPAEGLS